MDLEKIRSAFPHTQELIYMNHAALAPVGRHVKNAIDSYLRERHFENIENYFEFLPTIRETRDRVSQMLKTSADNVAFVANTSTGLNVLAQGLDWKKGDRILIPGCEFPANVYPFMALQSKGVYVDFVQHEEGTFSLADIENAITPQTRLLSLSWVQFLSGFRADLKAIGALCKARDIIFCVDAIQGLGALEIDVEGCGIDFLSSGGHKWLMSVQGIGVIYIAKVLLNQIEGPAGWLHGPIDWENLTHYELSFHKDARQFRLGTENAIGIAALHAALGFYLDAGPAWCESQILKNASRLRRGLESIGLEIYGKTKHVSNGHLSGIVTVKHHQGNELFELLKKKSIHIAVRNGLLRFAPTYYNDAREVDRVLEEVEKLLASYPV